MATEFDEDNFRNQVRGCLWAYFWQIKTNSTFFFQSFSELEREVALEHRNPERVFRLLTEILHNAAGISHLLWPGQARSSSRAKMAQIRGELLLAELGLTGEEHFLRDRSGRDHLAHLDERIDEWVIASRQHNIAAMNIGPKGRVVSGMESREIFELFDPDIFVFYFRGDEYDIRRLKLGVTDVSSRAEVLLNRL
ncbi:MAG TPA: hypothetical protein VG889_03995 [Rhizomicrobium sp.]|nr:hypothetical protein [Rhizomicrobium sp.]